MHARVSVVEADPDKIDHELRYFREEVQPDLEARPDFKGPSPSTTCRTATMEGRSR